MRGRALIARCPVCLYAGSLVPRELVAAAPRGARVVDSRRPGRTVRRRRDASGQPACRRFPR
ncbi:MAG: hypothetical protein ACLP9L_31040 [Thermoguttaceae bacterium]